MEMTRYAVEIGKGKFFVGMSDVCTAPDILAHMRGTENLLMDMALEPEIVKEAFDKITKMWVHTNEKLYELTNECNDGGTCIPWLHTWGPGRHAQQQCDLSSMFSAAMFEEFIVPEMEKELKWLEYSLFHLDGPECLQHLDHLLSLKELDVIEWHSGFDSGKPPTVKYMDMLKKIQKTGRGLHLYLQPWEVEVILSELSSKGLYIMTRTNTESEARELVKKVEGWTRE
jgi:hypothetical protein